MIRYKPGGETICKGYRMGWQSRGAALAALWVISARPAPADVTQGSGSNVQSTVKTAQPVRRRPAWRL